MKNIIPELGYQETQSENLSKLFLGWEVQYKLKLCYKMCPDGSGLNVEGWQGRIDWR